VRRHPHPVRLIAWVAFVAVFGAVAYYDYFYGPERVPGDALYLYETAVAGTLVFAVMLGLTLVIAAAGGGPARALLALRGPTSWWRAGGLALLVLAGAYALALVLGQAGLDPGREQGLLPQEWRPERARQYAANFLMITTLVPVVEELLFRGLGYSLLRPLGRGFAVVAVGIAFAAAHGLVEAFPLLAVLGMGLAVIRERTRSVLPCIALHGLFNAIAMLAVFARPG
jgi:uncharacterized protein